MSNNKLKFILSIVIPTSSIALSSVANAEGVKSSVVGNILNRANLPIVLLQSTPAPINSTTKKIDPTSKQIDPSTGKIIPAANPNDEGVSRTVGKDGKFITVDRNGKIIPTANPNDEGVSRTVGKDGKFIPAANPNN